ncbi:MAG TPA: STAS domain-containing protein [Mollicutes bacterium]|jgi:anti-anti-sigma regulatory factor|nr:STAS domain-containing protein [Mollicutes bacterium]
MLDIDTEFRKGILFVRLSGLLSSSNCCLLENDVGKLIVEDKVRFVTFNIYNLYFIDSEGVDTILKYNTILLKNNGIALVCGLERMLMKLRNRRDCNIKEVSDELSAIKYVNLGGYI